jgi:YD repeat-containing protein
MSTDARGAVSTYAYDQFNRVTSGSYSLGATTDQTIAFTYDAGTYGKGRRTGASDANHSLSWVYDSLGRVTSKSQTVGAVTKTVGYGYTNGNLTSMTTPSGQSVTYGYNSNHQATSIAVNGTTVLSGVTYDAFGPVKGWTWGNGTTSSRTFDYDGNVTQIVSSGTKNYAYDNAFRITGISDPGTPANSYTCAYDSLDRLTSAVKTGTTRGWTYDANGNRLSETGASPSTYTIFATNDQSFAPGRSTNGRRNASAARRAASGSPRTCARAASRALPRRTPSGASRPCSRSRP